MAGQDSQPKSIPLFSPEGAMIMLIAIITDVGGFLLGLIPVVGWALNIVLTIVVNIFFIVRRLFNKRMSAVGEKREKIQKGMVKAVKVAKIASKAGKWAKWLRWTRYVVEFIPYLNFLPLLAIGDFQGRKPI